MDFGRGLHFLPNRVPYNLLWETVQAVQGVRNEIEQKKFSVENQGKNIPAASPIIL